MTAFEHQKELWAKVPLVLLKTSPIPYVYFFAFVNVSLPYAVEYSFLTCGTELTSNAKKSLPYMVEYWKPKLLKTFSL